MSARIIRFVTLLLLANSTTSGAAQITAAEAAASKGKSATIPGVIDGDVARFKNVDPHVAHDVKLSLADGATLQGVNMGWYSIEPAKADAGELTDDDRQQITAILKDVPAFYNKNDLLILRGDHDRAVALVQLVRDSDFHSAKGDEVIWHVELWYFKNQHGGWEKVQQTNRVVRRERFASQQAYHAAIDHLRWMPDLGGLKAPNGASELTVTLPATEPPAASHSDTASTQPAK